MDRRGVMGQEGKGYRGREGDVYDVEEGMNVEEGKGQFGVKEEEEEQTMEERIGQEGNEGGIGLVGKTRERGKEN